MKKDNKILLSHGSGGIMSHKLIKDIFVKHFSNPLLEKQSDAAILPGTDSKLTFTTDSYVVDPIFFPGGNIGKLAVCGTVNDLAVSGAIPKYLSAGFIIEEGFPIDQLETIVKSMAEEARKANIEIVTGDTKVVNRGKCDKVFINTAGVGYLDDKQEEISYGTNIKSGDKIIINGTIGDHGIAIIGTRNELSFTSDIQSDCAPLNHLIQKAILISDNIKFMRDATRGGLATVMVELAENSNLGIKLYEDSIPVKESVRGMCEVFGFDPLHVANEGKVVMVVSAEDANKVLNAIRKDEYGKDAAIIGEVTTDNTGKVRLNTEIGGSRIVDMLAGEQLPRIC